LQSAARQRPLPPPGAPRAGSQLKKRLSADRSTLPVRRRRHREF
jgi:hypothetical protein